MLADALITAGPGPDTGLVAIVGPTGTGKSRVAMDVASRLGGEVVNADSRLVYRGMDIGTAKPPPEWRRQVPHHVLDVVEPEEAFNLARYLRLARESIAEIRARGRVPLLVGGTGLYVWGVLEGLRLPQVAPNPSLRRRLDERAAMEGTGALHGELERLDPEAARTIDARNVRRVVRALEVCLETGLPFSRLRRREPPAYRSLVVGLTLERERLYERLDHRTDRMVQEGWVEEVRRLRERGVTAGHASMSALGYREMLAHVEGEVDLEEAIRRTRSATRRFVRHQGSWFRAEDPRIEWVRAEAGAEERVTGLVASLRAREGEPGGRRGTIAT